jgi:hypothetical protein
MFISFLSGGTTALFPAGREANGFEIDLSANGVDA